MGSYKHLSWNRARHLFFPQLGRRTTIKQHGLVRNRNLLGHNNDILFFVFVMKKKTNRWKLWSFVRLLFFQDCCVWSTLTHHKSFVFLSRGNVVYPCPFWRQREQDYISKDKKSMEIKKKWFRTLTKLECTRHTHVISFHWCMFTENYYFNKKYDYVYGTLGYKVISWKGYFRVQSYERRNNG